LGGSLCMISSVSTINENIWHGYCFSNITIKLLLMTRILLFALFFPLFTHAQIITTAVGTGTGGYSGDGGPATDAMIWQWGIAMDGIGNLYIADGISNRIRKVNPSGIINTIAGNGTSVFGGDGGPATAAGLNLPIAVAVDAFGNVYIADRFHYVIRKVNTSGIITTIAGNGTNGNTGDGGAATVAEIGEIWGITIDGSGNLFFADYYNNVVRKINSVGIITTYAGNGSVVYSGDGGTAAAAGISHPSNVAVDISGNLYISEHGSSRIRKVSTSGIITTIAGNGIYGYGGDGGLAVSAAIQSPMGVGVDASGNVYIADELNYRVRKVSTSGIITTVAGNGTSGHTGDGGLAVSAELFAPVGVAIDGSGNLYISDGNSLTSEVYYGIRKVYFSTASVTSMKNEPVVVKVFPNPTAGELTIISNEKINSVDVINPLGQIFISNNYNSETVHLNIEELPSGLYYVKVNDLVQKIIKQ